MRRWSIVSIYLWMVIAVVLAGCSIIDDDLSDCGEDLRLDYDLHLVTNLSIELQKELDRTSDAKLQKALRDYLTPVFTDYAHDLDLSFYDVQGDSARLHHEQHIMDANELSYTIYLPRRSYLHTAVANVERNGVAVYEGGDYCHAGQLLLQSDTVGPHKTGLFTARQGLQIEEGVNRTYYVHLYMVNCAAALVLDTSEASLKDLKVMATGFASRYNIADSTYVFAGTAPVVRADKIDTGSSGRMCFCTVNFPSPEPTATRVTVNTEDPFVSVDAQDARWQFQVFATLADGKVTKSTLSVWKPLRPGQLKIIHANVYSNGSLEPDEPEVAVSVELDWKEAGNYVTPL